MPQTVFQSLAFYSEKQLRFFADLARLPDADQIPPSILRDRVEAHLQKREIIERVFNELDAVDKAYLAEILHNGSRLYLEAFEVKYGARPSIYRQGNQYICGLRLFADRNEVHRDLRDALLEFVPPPEKAIVKTIALPQDGAAIRFNESDALNDVLVLLNAVANGKLPITDKTQSLGTAAMKEIQKLIRRGDIYKDDDVDPIRSFAWTAFIAHSGYVKVRDGSLTLNDEGNHALFAPAADTLRHVWHKWILQGEFDELKRIDALKIDRGIGRKAHYKDHKRRRTKVESALSECPVGEWIAVDDFFEFIRKSGLHFELCFAEHGLMLLGNHIGQEQQRLCEYWNHAYGRYVLCFLMEYAATVGIIDIGYEHPSGARSDFQHLPDTERVRALSRYDGLRCFKITTLGEYILGKTETYKSPDMVPRQKLTVLSSLVLKFDNEPPAEQAILLDLFADRESDHRWRLSRLKTLQATQRGYAVKLLRDFIERFDDQPLPETVDAFLDLTERNSTALHSEEPAVLLQCTSAEIARKIAEHEMTSKLAMLAGGVHLVVRKKNEAAFRKAVNTIGYGFAVKNI
jgi:hypothetical protein